MGAEDIVNRMFDNDAFSQWLGVKILKVNEGYCLTQMSVTNNMTNGFKVAHGGISYALADSTLAFASNSHGNHAVSIETSISHTRPIMEGDILTAEAKEVNSSTSLGIYDVQVKNQKNKIVALFKGTVFIKDKKWENS